MSRYYFSYNEYLKKTFSEKVYKIPLDIGFTCPNRDGNLGYGGCVYCENKSFSPNSHGPARTVSEQIAEGIQIYKTRRKAQKFIAYFQAYTNTYGEVEHLRNLYAEALSFPDVVGLSIGTRPDCVPEDVLNLLEEYHRRTHLWVEYGLETIHDGILDWMGRGHGFAQFQDAMIRTQRRNLRVCVHVILGFPGETHQMMMETAETLATTGINALKVHHLYIAKKTLLEKLYHEGRIPVMDLETYIPLVCDFLERIPEDVTIQRVMGEIEGEYMVAPNWGFRKQDILKAIEAEFEKRGSRQGVRALQPG